MRNSGKVELGEVFQMKERSKKRVTIGIVSTLLGLGVIAAFIVARWGLLSLILVIWILFIVVAALG